MSTSFDSIVGHLEEAFPWEASISPSNTSSSKPLQYQSTPSPSNKSSNSDTFQNFLWGISMIDNHEIQANTKFDTSPIYDKKNPRPNTIIPSIIYHAYSKVSYLKSITTMPTYWGYPRVPNSYPIIRIKSMSRTQSKA